jgi:dimethylhistidine N-methyltransferase
MAPVPQKKIVSTASDFAADVISGLALTPKQIPPKYFYDAEGSGLFEQITTSAEYYPTRCEMQALREHAKEIAHLVPENAALIEFGTGSTKKARLLMKALPRLAAYVPVDISGEFLESESAGLRSDRPDLPVVPVIADFTRPFELPDVAKTASKRIGFFPGSTIGNFEPHEAAAFLRHAGDVLGSESVMIVGVDLVKDAEILNAAYNDKAGVTALFNLNLLKRANRELGSNFNLALFEHHAFYNRERKRIEMHLASTKRQRVQVAGETFDFRAGETIRTECSYKYTVESFGALARGSGWTPAGVWTDSKGYFSIHALKRATAKPFARLEIA